MEAYKKYQDSDKLSARRFEPVVILKLIGKNVLNLTLREHIMNHSAAQYIHTMRNKEYPAQINASIQPKLEWVQAEDREEYEIELILTHRKNG